MGDIRYEKQRTRAQPRALFVGRHFAWIARTMVKVAKELELTNAQFLKMLEILASELETTGNFNRKLFKEHVHFAAVRAKKYEELVED